MKKGLTFYQRFSESLSKLHSNLPDKQIEIEFVSKSVWFVLSLQTFSDKLFVSLAARLSKRLSNLSRILFRPNILLWQVFFTDRNRTKTLQTFQKCFDRIIKTGFYAFEGKVFPLPRITKKVLFENWHENFSSFSWTFSSVFSKLRYRFEKNKLLKIWFFKHVHSLHKTSSRFLARNLTHVCQKCIFLQYCGRDFFSDFGKNFGTPVNAPFCLSRKTWLIKKLIWKFFKLISHFE